MTALVRDGLVAFGLSLLLTGVGLGGLRRAGVLDRPNARSSHETPTVRGGGVGFVAVGTLAGLLAGGSLGLVAAAALLVAAVSFVDDLRGLGVRVRLLVHALVAAVPAALVLQAFGGLSSPLGWALAAVAFVGTVGYTNAFNFMDGIDGIAGAQGTLAAAHAAVVLARLAEPHGDLGLAGLAAALAGATAGFLPFNLPRARAFMGDVGSAFLGYTAACLVALGVAEHGLSALAPLALVHTPFVLDAGITLARRAARGERLAEAHREHLYQRAVRAGARHVETTARFAALAALGAGLGQLALGASGPIVCALVALEVAACLAVFASIERRFRAHATSGAPAAGSGTPTDVLRP